MPDVGLSGVGCRVPGAVYVLVLALFCALFLALFWPVLYTVLACPALPWPVSTPRICTRPYWCSARLPGTPCTPAPWVHPATTQHPGTRRTVSGCPAVSCRRCRGAHSGLHPGTEPRLMSPGPVFWPVYPLIDTPCSPPCVSQTGARTAIMAHLALIRPDN